MSMKNQMPDCADKWKHNIVTKSILLNLVYLFGMLLAFVPFFSIDDYLMSNTIYGVGRAGYDYHATYMNFVYGRLMVFLLRLFPEIPWYAVLFDLWVFIALTLLTYMILKWSNNYAGLILANLLLLFFSYEGYVAVQFTKVAGILGAVAVLVLLSEKIPRKPKMIGICLWILSCMIRIDCAKMALGVWGLLLVWKVLEATWKTRRNPIKEYWKRGFLFLAGACIFIIVPRLSSIGMTEAEKDFWKLFWEHNTVRAAMQDYSVPDYETYREAYEAIGISQNDLNLYWSWNWDCNVVTLEKGEIIQAMREGDDEKVEALVLAYKLSENSLKKESKEASLLLFSQSKENRAAPEKNEERFFASPDKQKGNPLRSAEDQTEISVFSSISATVLKLVTLLKRALDIDTLTAFFKVFPRAFLRIDVCTVYFIIMLAVLICWDIQKSVWCKGVFLSGGVLMLLNYYLYIKGRYLQHRADVGLFMIVIVSFLLLMTEREYQLADKARSQKLTFIVAILLMLCGKYGYWGDDRQSPDEVTIAQNKSFFAETFADDEHFYVFGSPRDLGATKFICSENAFDMPEIGAEQNITRLSAMFTLNTSDWFENTIDSQANYFMIGDTDKNEAAWETYFTEHAGKEIELVLVKQFFGKRIYRVRSQSVKETVNVSEMPESSEAILEHLECHVSDNRLTVLGTAYLAYKSGFSQNTYIQILDSRTGEYELYDTLAVCDETKNYGDEGYFSKLFADIELPDFYNRNSGVNLVIEQDGNFYYKSLNPKYS